MSDLRFLVLVAASLIALVVWIVASAAADEEASVTSCLATSVDSCACLSIQSVPAAEACYEAKGNGQ